MIALLWDNLQLFADVLQADWKSESSLVRGLLLPFTIAGFGAFFGAMAAAWTTRRISSENRQVLELETTNKAAILAGSVCSSALSFKRQHLQDMHQKFFDQRKDILNELGTPTNSKTIRCDFDLYSIVVPSMLSQELFESIAELRNSDPRVLVEAGAICASTNNLMSLVRQRNDWIEHFHQPGDKMNDELKTQVYFSLSQAGDVVDSTYKDFVENLHNTNDDIIFHSHEIARELTRDCFKQRRALRRPVGSKIEIGLVDFSAPRASGLFPDEALYSDWKRTEKSPKRRWNEARAKYDERTLKRVGF